VRVGRFTAGCIAAVVAGVATIIAAIVDARVSDRLNGKALAGLFMAVAGGVLWLGEEYGLIADPYRDSSKSPLSLKTPPE
jgi:drug/metabolite transporter (DMT)-like permease